MAAMLILLALASSASLHPAGAALASPVGKVIQLLSDLESKIIAEGTVAQAEYAEFSEWCEERSKDLAFQIKTGKDDGADLEAVITQEASIISSLDEKVQALSGSIAQDEADLKAATFIRDTEAKDFAAVEKELMETIDTLQRAVGILEKHASMLQFKNAGTLAQALDALVQASALSSADAKHLTALVQSSQESQASDEQADVGAPAAAVYEGRSGDIVETLTSLMEKAQEQLASSRKTETNNMHNYELLKQSIEDELKVGNKEMAEAKMGLAASGEKKAAAEGDLEMNKKSLVADEAALADLHQDCMSKAQNYEAEVKSRGEELSALAKAKQIISDNTAGADSLSYGLSQVSLVQLASGSDLAKVEAVRFVRSLSQKQHSPALAQLATRMASAARSETGDDPFTKVKALIADMIERLEGEAEADATHKSYCDKELSESKVKQADKTTEIEKFSTKIDGMTARSAQLKAEATALSEELVEIAKAQAEMDKLRAEEKEAYAKNKADMEQGLEGVKRALKVLNDYYGNEDTSHAAAEGAGSGIIGLLEVVESDFTKGLSEMVATEESAASDYDKETKENEIETTTKDQDVKYKSEESISLDKAVAEATSDRSGVQDELGAVMEYFGSLEKQCIEKAETYEERKARYESELAGLKQALEILEGEAVLLQQSQSTKRSLRAVRPHLKAM